MDKKPITVLFVCIHNSARSQMAEAFVNASGRDDVRAESAGLEAGRLNPLVVESMKEIGIDISGNRTKTVGDMLAHGGKYDYVVTVCDGASAERCPVFPGGGFRLHWDFPDPSALRGEKNEVLAGIRAVRDRIRAAAETWLAGLG
ncbi:MAG: arsenate reductase ArsC [Spirochaetales bacterium]|nr:arsenate reductase ArsC [Spirochaetales bacterium]